MTTDYDNDIIETVRQRLILRRRHLGWSQNQLAQRMGVSQDIVSRLERGLKKPHLTRCMWWADALGLTLTVHLDVREPA